MPDKEVIVATEVAVTTAPYPEPSVTEIQTAYPIFAESPVPIDPTATEMPTEAPTQPGCIGHLEIGGVFVVSLQPPLPSRIRSEPNQQAEILGQIQPGEKVMVMDGPQCSEGYIWWQVKSTTNGLEGWTPEGDGLQRWLIPESHLTLAWKCWSSNCQPITDGQIMDIEFVSDTEAWAVGSGIYFWNGMEWRFIDSSRYGNLNAVTFLSATDGWAVGDGAQILHWDGNQWTTVKEPIAPDPGPAGTQYTLYDVDFVNATDGWAVGDINTEGGGGPVLIHWDGNEWEDVDSRTMPSSWGSGLEEVVAVADNNVWVVGGGEEAVTWQWNGETWKAIPSPSKYWIYAIDSLAPNNLWVAGLEQQPQSAFSYIWVVFRWDGDGWEKISLPDGQYDPYMLDIKIVSEDLVLVSGSQQWLWDGTTWRQLTIEAPPNEWIFRITAVETSPNGRIWAMTRHGALLVLEVSQMRFKPN